MFFRDFLMRAVDAGDEVTRAFVETMVPALIVHYSDTSAKGGDHARDDMYDEQTKRKFEDKGDQSMLSHQLNGIFPALRLLNILEKEDLVAVPYSDIERRVYILSYLMHDVNKIFNIRDLETRTRPAVEEAKTVIAGELEKCGADTFLPRLASIPGGYRLSRSQYTGAVGDASEHLWLESATT